jgi:DNA polymerase III delta subunit
MSESQIRLLVGDAYRCERALAEREQDLRTADPEIERHVLFGDELDASSFEIELRSSSLFALGRHFLLRQADRVRAPKSLVAALEDEIPAETFVTLLARELKGTNPILKLLKKRGAVVSLPAPKGRSVASSARDLLHDLGVDGSTESLRRMVFRNGGDLLGIAQEGRKLRSFNPDAPLTPETVDRMVFPSAERTVYPFFDRLGERKLPEALAELGALRDDPGRMLGGALRHLARLAMVRVVLDQNGPRRSVADALGLPDWMCRRLIAQAKTRRLADLARALGEGVRLDVRVKSGEITARDALLELTFAAAA